MWRFRLKVLLSQKSQEVHVKNQVWEVQEVQEVQEVVTRTLDEERSCLVPVWITSTGKEENSNMDCFNREREVDNDEQLHVLYGLPQQGREALVVLHKCYRRKMIGPDFDVGRVSRFQCGLLHENFSSIVLRRYYKRRGFVQSWERVSLFQCGFYIRTTSLLFCTDVTSNKRRKCREEGSKLSSFLEPLFEQMLQDNFFLLCQTFFMCIILRFLYEIVYF